MVDILSALCYTQYLSFILTDKVSHFFSLCLKWLLRAFQLHAYNTPVQGSCTTLSIRSTSVQEIVNFLFIIRLQECCLCLFLFHPGTHWVLSFHRSCFCYSSSKFSAGVEVLPLLYFWYLYFLETVLFHVRSPDSTTQMLSLSPWYFQVCLEFDSLTY